MPFQAEQSTATSLLGTLDHLTKKNPTTTWIHIPKSSDLRDGWREVTYCEASYAVDGLSEWIKDNVNLECRREVIAYMGDNDERYMLLLLSIMRLGHTLMFTSPRNSPEGQRNLFRITGCSILLHSASYNVKSTQSLGTNLKTYQIPSFDELLQAGRQRQPIDSHPEMNDDEPVLILHTSGSTGLPKPIYLPKTYFSTMAELKNMTAPVGRQNMWKCLSVPGEPMFNMMPFFHAAGIIVMCTSLFDIRPTILPPVGRPIDSELIIEIFQQKPPHTAILAPSVLEDVSKTQRGLDSLSVLSYLGWGGAPLGFEVGQRVRKQTRHSPCLGITEAGVLPTLIPEATEDWSYYEWTTESGIEMEPDGDGLYESVIKWTLNGRFQPIFCTFPDIKEYRTKDLFAPHPKKPNLWEYRGRRDDVLVLTNGEKVQPVTFEKTIESHALVKGAIVIGEGRFQTSLFIELDWTAIAHDSTNEDVIETLWPAIEHANKNLPTHGQIWRNKVSIATRDKPFARAAKGSIIRRATNQLYEAEIEAMYSGDSIDDKLGKLDENADAATVRALVRQIVTSTNLDFPTDGSDDLDFFAAGFNSLQVLGLSNALSHACSDGKPVVIAGKDIYANSSINALTDYILRARGQIEHTKGLEREAIILQLIEKYTQTLPKREPFPSRPTPSTHTIVLTGSTGGLGNYILQELIATSTVSHIYCLNRSIDAADRQKHSFKFRNVSPDFGKVTFLQADFSQHHFGLSDKTYTTILTTTTLFIHNAWAVDFNKSLKSYEETHIAGVRRIIDFSISSTHSVAISFISSIGAVSNWSHIHPSSPKVPEQLFHNPAITIPQGYSESKYIAEHILSTASAQSCIQTTIIRSGQLAGSTTKEGLWNPNEWLPSLISTSKALNLIPSTLGTHNTVDWVPLDAAARIVTESVFARASDPAPNQETYHLINPRTTTWSELTPTLQSAFPGSHIVPFTHWVDALSDIPTTPDHIAKYPGLKLLDFYRGLGSGQIDDQENGMSELKRNLERVTMPRLESEKTEKVSEAMRALEGVGGELMDNWLRQWGLLE